MRKFAQAVAVAVILLAVPAARSAQQGYSTGTKEAEEIGLDLNKALDKKFLGMLRAQPVTIRVDPVPVLRISEEDASSGQRKVGIVIVSSGFIDLINRVAHAKAIDKIEKGYFVKYLQSWPTEGASTNLPELPNISNPRFWAEEVMDQQTTYFSQMLGTALGIKYANYCLGQYAKYSAKMNVPGQDPAPLNRFLTATEWEAAVAAGAKNALACAYGVDGIVTLFECVDGMAKRPEWTLYFAPDGSVVKVSKLKKELARIEKEFFVGG